jgi:hypothetical protein
VAVDERQRRLALNEALFRQVNERLEELNETFAEFTGTLDLICECSETGCAERLRVRPEVYERVRSDPLLFFVVPGHEIEDIEDKTGEGGPGYEIVRKRGSAGMQVANATDPRDPS